MPLELLKQRGTVGSRARAARSWSRMGSMASQAEQIQRVSGKPSLCVKASFQAGWILCLCKARLASGNLLLVDHVYALPIERNTRGTDQQHYPVLEVSARGAAQVRAALGTSCPKLAEHAAPSRLVKTLKNVMGGPHRWLQLRRFEPSLTIQSDQSEKQLTECLRHSLGSIAKCPGFARPASLGELGSFQMGPR